MRLPRPLISVISLTLLMLSLPIVGIAQSPAPSTSPATVPFTGSELTRLKLLSAYKGALLAQQSAQAALQKAIGDWNAASEQAIKDEKLAKGTVFQVDLAKDEVLMIVPHPADPTKAPTKKESPPPPQKK